MATADVSITTLDLRGRDLIILCPAEWYSLPLARLLEKLFGSRLPESVRSRFVQDKRHHFLRIQPRLFQVVRKALEEQQTPFTVAFNERPALESETRLTLEPRPYQIAALECWQAAQSAGVVVLPTGAGKTFVAAMAINATRRWTLVVVPTIDLLQQWRLALAQALSLDLTEIGLFGGGEKELRPITIMTYDSAALYPRELHRFGLLVFDECHHLPAPTYRFIAEGAFTPLRLGLSATPERSDMAHEELEVLIGPEVYRRSPAELTKGSYLANYREIKIGISLSPEEEARYAEQRQVYRSFLQRRRIFIRTPEDFQQKLIFMSARDPEARAAMLAWRETRNIALNSSAKYAEVEQILSRHLDDQVLLFSEYNYVVDEISRRFCLPSITYKTPQEERRIILERFKSGQYTKLVTGRVLNEGVDVPDCRVAIIVSGNATKREYIQRLGRILRPKSGQALLYELVTRGTTEEDMAKRRR
ncbi:MAG TPA: DEAD/DEAH box helicase [Ktedonobacteraceae bacterium]|nr:DEAD/DEAH box helicase [Ktedonobacteraceae bacterium]